MTSTTQTAATYYLLERSGNSRQMFGPYTLAYCQRAKGKLYEIVTGTRCRNALTLADGQVRDAKQGGGIVEAE